MFSVSLHFIWTFGIFVYTMNAFAHSFVSSFNIFDFCLLKKKEKKRKEKRKDMLMYGISFHWVFMPPFEVHLLGIFVIMGFCEFL